MPLLPRYTNNDCNDGYNNGYNDGYGCNYNSSWSNWGRWVVLAAIIVGAFFIFLIFSCITARRRRRQGQNPWRGTGWAGGRTPAGHGPAQYTGQPAPAYGNNNGAAAPPVYSPQPTQGGYYNQGYNSGGANQGYFGGQQQQGVELQQPENVYARDGDYAPPAGPPPGKGGDGIIR
ncbi:hypothetical protein P7C71_g332, partial [Lecanoromycetidae sp. Uapishka_2]